MINHYQDDYKIIELIGTGSHSDVFTAISMKDKQKVVIKKIEKKYFANNEIYEEIKILNILKKYCDKYVICYIGFYEDENYFYIITENLENYIDLKTFIYKYEEQKEDDGEIYNVNKYFPIRKKLLATIAKNLCDGLKFIHKLGICHLDIKPANIMVNIYNGDIKFIDFGTSCIEILVLTTDMVLIIICHQKLLLTI